MAKKLAGLKLNPTIRDFELAVLNYAKYNPRTISKEAMAGLSSSIEKFGCVDMIIVNVRDDRNVIVSGHQRHKALCSKLGNKAIMPCVVVDLCDADEKLLNLTMNNPEIQGDFIAELDDYIDDLRELLDVDADYFNLRIDELRNDIDRADPKPEDDEIPENIDAVAKLGDLWQLGEHLLVCGDSTDPVTIARLGDWNIVDLVFTDPPYNMTYKSKKLGGIKNDNMADAEFVRFILSSAAIIQKLLRSGGSFYICMSGAEYPTVYHQLRKLGLSGRQLIWAKPSTGLGAQEYRPQFEVMLYGYTGKRSKRCWNGKRHESDLWSFDIGSGVVARETDTGMIIEVGNGIETTQIVLDAKTTGKVLTFDGSCDDIWQFGRPKGDYVHPTQKPVALVERAILNSSKPDNIVFDAFTGSGSTLIACEKLGRRFIGCELDPKYCDVIISRWQNYTGGQAIKVE